MLIPGPYYCILTWKSMTRVDPGGVEGGTFQTFSIRPCMNDVFQSRVFSCILRRSYGRGCGSMWGSNWASERGPNIPLGLKWSSYKANNNRQGTLRAPLIAWKFVSSPCSALLFYKLAKPSKINDSHSRLDSRQPCTQTQGALKI